MNGTGLRVEESGAGREAVVLSPPMFTTRQVFRPLVEALAPRYRCITYDHRGQGASGFGLPQPSPELFGVEGLYDDAVALLDDLGVRAFHWVGVSLGGFVGMRVAARHPDRVLSLTLVGPRVGALPKRRLLGYEALGVAMRAARPLRPLSAAVRGRAADLVMRGLFGTAFMLDPQREETRRRWRELVHAQMVPEGIPMMRQLFRSEGNGLDLLSGIRAPTLVLAGAGDRELEEARRVADAIPHARFEVIPEAGHVVLVEQPGDAEAAVTGFLRRAGPPWRVPRGPMAVRGYPLASRPAAWKAMGMSGMEKVHSGIGTLETVLAKVDTAVTAAEEALAEADLDAPKEAVGKAVERVKGQDLQAPREALSKAADMLADAELETPAKFLERAADKLAEVDGSRHPSRKLAKAVLGLALVGLGIGVAVAIRRTRAGRAAAAEYVIEQPEEPVPPTDEARLPEESEPEEGRVPEPPAADKPAEGS